MSTPRSSDEVGHEYAHHKDPADLLSFIGHTLGFWPPESLVCITLDKSKVGATLRIDLPKQPGQEIHFARIVTAYLEQILFAQTDSTPNWSRIEWAKDLLLHVYTRTSPEHAAPILTTISYINWWEGRGSKAHQHLQLALDTDLGDRFARLTDHTLGAGIMADWNSNKNTAESIHLEMP
ncbi:DUF4192 family protein [Paenarthrobacter sp. NCHU4564]|uniref:DUF4192 family protein n=1 Tax=Paenarthrobacter sp. NCHU4564 TaxID=3451353 RepID=UPI003F9A26C6